MNIQNLMVNFKGTKNQSEQLISQIKKLEKYGLIDLLADKISNHNLFRRECQMII